jgi:excisionase family DNA binding protein
MMRDLIDTDPITETRAMTPAQVAVRWACSERKVRNMIERGALPAFKLDGKMLRLWRKDVEEYECRGGSQNCEANTASPGTTQPASGDVIDLGQATRKRRTASPRLSTLSLRDRVGKR